ncbi:MAG: sulfatase-like hydrolase/transferase [Planctomycetota bacterium]
MTAPAPSIVFITTDTQGQNMVSAYGERAGVETPCLDRLAREGTLFENAFCASPVCTPARSAWYSGLHPNRNGAWTNNVTMRRGLSLLAERLDDAGYRCVHLGKWHLDGGAYNGSGEPDGGFSEPWYDLASFHREHPQEGPNRFGAWNRGLEDPAYCFGHCVADRAIETMRTHTGGPLFLAVEFDEPHGPYICPPPFHGRHAHEGVFRPATLHADRSGKPAIQQTYARFLAEGRDNPEDLPAYYRLYHDCNSYVDSEIGRVLDAVDTHLPPDTVVIFTSDHGDHHGAFGLCAKGPTMYEATCAVPLIIRSPAFGHGVRTPHLASGVDLYPTILQIAGVAPVGNPTGRGDAVSLCPVLRGEKVTLRDHVIIEYNRFGVAHDQDDGFFPIRCIRTATHKLAVNLFDRDELYDLVADPDEAENRIDDPACTTVRNELHDRLLAWQCATQDPFRGPGWTLRPWRTDRTHAFEGLFTTGYKDAWTDHDFHKPDPDRQEQRP